VGFPLLLLEAARLRLASLRASTGGRLRNRVWEDHKGMPILTAVPQSRTTIPGME
jgi:hypothetical protein